MVGGASGGNNTEKVMDMFAKRRCRELGESVGL